MEIAGVRISELKLDDIGSWPMVLKGTLMVLVSLFTFYIGYSIDLSDMLDTLSTLQKKQKEASQLFFDTQQKVANLGEYKKEVKLVSEQLTKLTEQLPIDNEEAGLLEDITQQANSYGLQFVTIIPGKHESMGFYEESPIEMTITGDYKSLAEFSSKISGLQRIITLHDFTMKKNDSKGRGSLSMDVVAKTYWITAKEQSK